MSRKKATSTNQQRINAGRDVNIVALGAQAKADQVAAGEAVKQKTTRPAAPASRDLAIASNALRAAALEMEPLAGASLSEEIKMLRRYTKQVGQFIEKAEPERAAALLNALSLAMTRVANLLKAQKELSGKSGGLVELLQRALHEVLEEQSARD